MQIPIINTSCFIDEKPTNGHSPMLFLCDDDCKYYVKYLVEPNRLDFLLFEFIGSILCRHHNIPTPDIAFVKIIEGSYNKKELKENKKWIRNDAIAFGSKEIPNHDLFDRMFTPLSRADFNKIINPYDVVKIALLDLWIYNTDRKEDRYNFIFENTESGKMIYAIDHAFSFGGVKQKHISPNDNIHTADTLLDSTLLRKLLTFMDKGRLVKLIDEFYYLCNDESKTLINSLFAQIPSPWSIDNSLKNNILTFLYNKERLTKLKLEAQRILLNK